jgi:3-isopropylmalate dehydratase small subunit
VIALVEVARRKAQLRLWSSREHAVWGLSQLGIRALIGTTFTGIFYDNCLRNGMPSRSHQVSRPDLNGGFHGSQFSLTARRYVGSGSPEDGPRPGQ